MANEKDKALFLEIEKVYDNAAKHLQQLQEKQAELLTKFGPSSRITQAGETNVQNFRTLYDKTLNYINFLRELNDKMYDNLIAAELMRQKSETGLPYANIATLAGLDPAKWAALDKIEGVIKKAKDRIGDNSDLDDFISWLKFGHGVPDRKGLTDISEVIRK